ncbi:hypothetical protein AYI69_g5031 [Smittium culicis]|uniref:Uncharacterized protein n=1 Tax=Smittium culicis TaxID=133412 RepID=A0A1R1Y8K5_9FUNG|nr:hypothetical protein AYI69_g5031 [Smittium culicis]
MEGLSRLYVASKKEEFYRLDCKCTCEIDSTGLENLQYQIQDLGYLNNSVSSSESDLIVNYPTSLKNTMKAHKLILIQILAFCIIMING